MAFAAEIIGMRCFLAVDLDGRLKEGVMALQKELKDLDTTLTKPENLHFTLKFLDEVDVKTVSEVERRISELAAKTKPFNAAIKDIGVFPSESHINVVWLGAPDMTNLHIAVEDALSGLFKKEKPVPHLTVARIRSQAYANYITGFVNKNKNINIGSMKVGSIKLKKSTLTRNGPVYEDAKAFELIG